MRAFYENRLYETGIPVSAFFSNNIAFLAHWHTEIELIYVCSGSIRMGINNEKCVLNQGDIAICSSGDIHYYDSTGMSSTVIIIIFHPEFIGHYGIWPINLQFTPPFIEAKKLEAFGVDSLAVKKQLYSLVAEIESKSKYSDMFIKSILLQLCATALRYFPSAPSDLKSGIQRFSGMQIIKGAIDFIESNYMNDISLDDTAKYINISPCYFSRLFKKITGMNFKLYLNSIRVDMAEELIRNSHCPIIDIAYECGFNSIRTFNRAFRTIKGFTPSNLR